MRFLDNNLVLGDKLVLRDSIVIGNDIVDFRSCPQALHPRFEKRILTAHEQEVYNLRFRQDPRKIWLYWAAKEAAYKAIKRRHSTLVFRPNLIELSEDLSTVSICENSFYIEWEENENFLHLVCSGSKKDLSNSTVVLEKGNYRTDLSELARQAVKRRLAKELNLSEKQIKIGKHVPSNAPYISLNNDQEDIVLSLSHDGCYFAAAYLARA